VRSKHPATAANNTSSAPQAKLHMTLKGHYKSITSLNFSPDNLMLATGCSSGLVNIWSLVVSLHSVCESMYIVCGWSASLLTWSHRLYTRTYLKYMVSQYNVVNMSFNY